MKQLLLLLITLAMFSCARHNLTPSVNIISKETQGLLLVECDGQGTTRAVAEADAKTAILNRLLYDGIPNSEVTAVRLPFIENKSKLSNQQRSEANKLTQGDAINRYFTEVNPIGTNNEKGFQLHRFSMKVNYDLFRRDLESKGVIRKFGL